MSRTYRKGQTVYSYYRSPKGKKQALINNARSGAIPPSNWDSVSFDPENSIPFKAAIKMFRRGWQTLIVERRLCKKYKLTHVEAQQIIKIILCHPRPFGIEIKEEDAQ